MMELGNLMFGNSRGEFEVPRDVVNTSEWNEILSLLGLDDYGIVTNKKAEFEKYYDNDSGGINLGELKIYPYYWGKDKKLQERHNFIFKDAWIDWYKYPFRDAYSNKQLTKEECRQLFYEVIKYAKSKKIV